LSGPAVVNADISRSVGGEGNPIAGSGSAAFRAVATVVIIKNRLIILEAIETQYDDISARGGREQGAESR